jgi:hypothetical protein
MFDRAGILSRYIPSVRDLLGLTSGSWTIIADMSSLISFDCTDTGRESRSRRTPMTHLSIASFSLKFFPGEFMHVPKISEISELGHALERLRIWNNSEEQK